ncbi:hypothetical protein WG901_21045 [Novosphingobium sp. PS1R-30]|uniref:TetR family transcriptional regulator n=1 Tax=Novosphingobium anseongense TaxID=3133436 RepID=A0ABU8S1B9_9SPHN
MKTAALLLDARSEQADLTIAVHVLLAEASSKASPYREVVQQLNEAATSFIWRNLEAAVAKKEIAPLHCTKSTSIIVMAMVRGSLLQWLVDASVSMETLRSELLSLLRSMLGLDSVEESPLAGPP